MIITDEVVDMITKGCANFGIDLECGACASIFFTGYSGYPHSCGKVEEGVPFITAISSDSPIPRKI